MCGICGFYGFGDKNLIKRMCKVLTHRGPDDEGYFYDKNITLGVRRLSIIDIKGGHQPIHNENESVLIIFNGEIYNYIELRELLEKKRHKFYTKSDTEVIIHCYEEFGIDCVKKLRGDFSFAIWDSDRKKLMLARNRLGVTPLYYTIIDKSIIFASEVKAILEYEKIKRELDFEALHYYLTFQYVPSPLTAFKGIKKLPPGHILVWENGKCKISKYWDVESKTTSFSEDYYAKKVLELLRESVKIRLMGEVPLGISLSGGLDSSSVAALANEFVNEPLKTFSVGAEGQPDIGYAKLIAEKFETDHKEIFMEIEGIIKNLNKIFWHMDEPMGDAAMVPSFFLYKLAGEKVRIALSGIGGDELFGGYYNYNNVIFFHRMKKIMLGPLKPHVPKIVKFLNSSEAASAYANFVSSKRNDEIIYKTQAYLFYYDKDSLYNKNMKSLTSGVVPENMIKDYFFNNNFDLFHKLSYLDMKMFVPDDCLNSIDRMGYASSVECRAPVLDHKLVEFAFEIPARFKIRGKTVKFILKKAMKNHLPKEVLERKKMGFPAPSNQWFCDANFKDFTKNFLDGSEIVKKYFTDEKIKQLLKNSNKPKEGHQLWGLVALAAWYKNFFEGNKW